MKSFFEKISSIKKLNADAMNQAQARLDRLVKPQKSLGVLEDLVIKLAGITGEANPKISCPRHIVFASDHGVAENGVASAPQEVTRIMSGLIASGKSGAGSMAGFFGIPTTVYDVGVIGRDAPTGCIDIKIRKAVMGDDFNYSNSVSNAYNSPSHLSGSKNEQHTENNFVQDRYTENKFGNNLTEDILKDKYYQSSDITIARAMSIPETIYTMEKAIEQVLDGDGDIYFIGEMGIGNTTPSTAILSVISGQEAELLTGIGANLEASKLLIKADVVKRSVDRYKSVDVNQEIQFLKKMYFSCSISKYSPCDDNSSCSEISDFSDEQLGMIVLLSHLGGFDIASMVGAIFGCSIKGVPCVIDGYISTIAAIIASKTMPLSKEYMIVSHRSAEKSGSLASEILGLLPPLDFGMRLGEGSGGIFMYPIIKAALTMYEEMATFGDSGIGVV